MIACTICSAPVDDEAGFREWRINWATVLFCPDCFTGLMEVAEDEIAGYDEDYLKALVEKWGVSNGRQDESAKH